MQHYIYPLPPPLPPPQPTGGRGTILSQEARLHALQIAEEIQAERGSYRKWNEVAKAVNRQYGSNVDGDLVKRQVTSMLRSVQRSGLNSVKRPRKHAEVIQQLLDPVPKRMPVGLLEDGMGGMDGEPRSEVINVELDDHGSNTGSEGGSPPTSPRLPQQQTPQVSSLEAGDGSNLATGALTTSAPSGDPIIGTPMLLGDPTKQTDGVSPLTPSTTTTSTSTTSALLEALKKTVGNKHGIDLDSHSIERVAKPKKPRAERKPPMQQVHSFMPQPVGHYTTAPMRVLHNMNVDEVYGLITRLCPDIDAEFIRTQDIDGNAYQVLSHKELTDFGVNTFGKRNKLLSLQAGMGFDHPAVLAPSPGNPQDLFYGRVPFTSSGGFLEAKSEGDKDGKEAAEKKPPVTKILDLEVVGVRKRYLIERENGLIEVLTPCKLRKYKNLIAGFEHIHPDKLVPIPAFSATFTHVPSSMAEDGKPPTPTDSLSPSSTPTDPSSASTLNKSKGSKSASASVSPSSASKYIPSSAYYSVYYPSGMPPSYPVSSHPNNLQWVPSPYAGVSSQRAPEKYHSFHPYNPPSK